nr:bifunctional hydroxymethylpyrimidine kinase/phosphomethylpyrimidine kinase [Oceanicoccus sp. KOV_DT_Chl]
MTDSHLLIEQIRAILEDIPIHLFNIGELASISNTEAMHTILNDYPNIPVLLHLKLNSLNKKIGMDQALSNLLFGQTDLLILNKQDALALAPGADTLAACAQEILEYGCKNILICDSNNGSNEIYNYWFSAHSNNQCYQWQRLPNTFLGAADTLSAAAAAYLAHGFSMAESIQQAQQFTFQALQKGRRVGMGELLPDRMHWSKK